MEANDAVIVAGMPGPKQLPNELLLGLSVSTATKLHASRYSSLCLFYIFLKYNNRDAQNVAVML